MGKVSKVVLYTTSTATTLKLKADIKRIRELLEAKKVHYEEVKGGRSNKPGAKHQNCGRHINT